MEEGELFASNRDFDGEGEGPVVVHRRGGTGHLHLVRTERGKNFSCGEPCRGCTGFRGYDGKAKLYPERCVMAETKCGIRVRGG